MLYDDIGADEEVFVAKGGFEDRYVVLLEKLIGLPERVFVVERLDLDPAWKVALCEFAYLESTIREMAEKRVVDLLIRVLFFVCVIELRRTLHCHFEARLGEVSWAVHSLYVSGQTRGGCALGYRLLRGRNWLELVYRLKRLPW